MKKRVKIIYYFYLIILPIFFILLKLFENWSKAYSTQTFTPISTIMAVGLPIVYGLLIGIDTFFMDKLLKKRSNLAQNNRNCYFINRVSNQLCKTLQLALCNEPTGFFRVPNSYANSSNMSTQSGKSKRLSLLARKNSILVEFFLLWLLQ